MLELDIRYAWQVSSNHRSNSFSTAPIQTPPTLLLSVSSSTLHRMTNLVPRTPLTGLEAPLSAQMLGSSRFKTSRKTSTLSIPPTVRQIQMHLPREVSAPPTHSTDRLHTSHCLAPYHHQPLLLPCSPSAHSSINRFNQPFLDLFAF